MKHFRQKKFTSKRFNGSKNVSHTLLVLVVAGLMSIGFFYFSSLPSTSAPTPPLIKAVPTPTSYVEEPVEEDIEDMLEPEEETLVEKNQELSPLATLFKQGPSSPATQVSIIIQEAAHLSSSAWKSLSRVKPLPLTFIVSLQTFRTKPLAIKNLLRKGELLIDFPAAPSFSALEKAFMKPQSSRVLGLFFSAKSPTLTKKMPHQLISLLKKKNKSLLVEKYSLRGIQHSLFTSKIPYLTSSTILIDNPKSKLPSVLPSSTPFIIVVTPSPKTFQKMLAWVKGVKQQKKAIFVPLSTLFQESHTIKIDPHTADRYSVGFR